MDVNDKTDANGNTYEKTTLAPTKCPDATHNLMTTHPTTMKAHCIRLLPGDDLVESMTQFAKDKDINAGVVLSCVGSTGPKTTLRPAAVPKARIFEGPHEILSFTGTFSKHGHHLHLSVSDSNCSVKGGHALVGCTVRTTAEICVGIIDNVKFTRPLDARTGYDELSIDKI